MKLNSFNVDGIGLYLSGNGKISLDDVQELNGDIDYYDGLNDGVKAGKVKSVTGSSPGIKVSVGQFELNINHKED